MIVAALSGWAAVLAMAGVALRLRATNGARAESVARVTHELRGSLQTAGLILQHSTCAPVFEPEARALQLELDKAAMVVTDLDGRRRSPPDGHFDLAVLLDRQAGAWAALAARAGRELEVQTPGGSLMSVGDPVRVAQVLANLVANALEHGEGRVDVCTWIAGPEAVVVEVADHGEGLPAAVEVLVARPRRGHGRRGRGLAIAWAIVENLGGRLSAERTADGSRLLVELPSWGP